MRHPRTAHLMCGLLLGVALPGSASAATLDRLLNESIPASACQPVSPEDRDASALTETGWTFADEMNGTIELECPIVTPYQYTVEPERAIPQVSLWYLDQDGTNTFRNVSSELCFRPPDATGATCYTSLDSSSSAATSYSAVTQTFHSLAVSMTDAQYFVRVTLAYGGRNGAGEVVFKGLSFTEEPP